MFRTCGDVRSGIVSSTSMPPRVSASTLLGLFVSRRPERRKSEAAVGVDRVVAVLLEHVGAELVREPDPASLVVCRIDEDTASFSCNLARCLPELGAAVAAERSKRITGQTFGVEPSQDGPAVADLPAHEREVDVPGSELEPPELELSERGAERERRDVTKRHSPLL